MAIAMTISPAQSAGAGTPSPSSNTASLTGLTTASTYLVTVVGPNGTQNCPATLPTIGPFVLTGAGTTGSVTWNPDGEGNYTFYTTLISAAAAVPAGVFYVQAIN